MNKRRLATLGFILMFLFLFVPTMAVKAGGSTSISGSGTASSPYVISDILWYDGGNSQLDFVKAPKDAYGDYTYFRITYQMDCILSFEGVKDVEYRGKNNAIIPYDNCFFPAGKTVDFRVPNSSITGESFTPGKYMFYLHLTELEHATLDSSGRSVSMNTWTSFSYSGSTKLNIHIDHPSYLWLYFYDKNANAFSTMPAGTEWDEGWTRTLPPSSGAVGKYVDDKEATAVWMDAGDYTFNIPYISSCPNFIFCAKTQDYNFGTVNVSWSNSYSDFKVTLTPGDNPDGDTARLDGWSWPFDTTHNYGNLSGTSGSGHIDHSFDTAGYASLTIKLTGHTLGRTPTVYKTLHPTTLAISPKKPTTSLTNVKRTSATFNLTLVNKADHGDKLLVQRKVSGVWKTIKTVTITSGISKITVTGLKAKTTYTMRVVGQVSAKNGYKALVGSGKSYTFKTGLPTKPSVKSVKVSKVRVKKVPKTYHSGHWAGSGSSSTWIPGYYTGGYVTTSFRVTITLRKAAKGSKGLSVNGVFMKGTGRKFTGTLSFKGKSSVKGKRKGITICSAMSKSYGGFSPSVTKKVRIK